MNRHLLRNGELEIDKYSYVRSNMPDISVLETSILVAAVAIALYIGARGKGER